MANIFTQFFKQAATKDPAALKQTIRNDFLRREAQIGRDVFGPIPTGNNREFFRLDDKTWIWQETWKENGQPKTKYTKYLLRDRDVVKSVNGQPYEQTSLKEAKNLQGAIHTYADRVEKQVYQPLLRQR